MYKCKHVHAGVEDDSGEPLLRCVRFCGDLPPGCCGGFPPPRGQAAGLPQGLCRGLSRVPGGSSNDHGSSQTTGKVLAS